MSDNKKKLNEQLVKIVMDDSLTDDEKFCVIGNKFKGTGEIKR
jgi:hypothetical protein